MSFFWTLKIETNWIFTFFKLHDHSAALTESIASSTVSKTKKQASNASSTRVKKTSHEDPVQITSVNEYQENEHSSDMVSIEQASLSLKNT